VEGAGGHSDRLDRLFAVPNFFPDHVVKTWPKWAQRHVVLGLDLQGGSHILLEVDPTR
jgi:preprotein translocase subunit SecD